MRIVLAVLPLLGQFLLSAPARAERALVFAPANAAESRTTDCAAGRVPRNGACVNMAAGTLAPKCPSRIADGAGGCAPMPATCSPAQTPMNGGCVNMAAGSRASGCPSGAADGSGGCAPAQSGGAPPTQGAVVSSVRPPTSIQALGEMQVPWTVSIRPATNFAPIGNCVAVYIDLFDAAKKDIPRNPIGQRVSIADFDWTATGNAAVGKYNGPNAWTVCPCPAAAVGSTIHVMATYPAASLPDKSKVPGLAFQSYIELPISKAPGTNVPAGCDNVLVTTTVATSVPGGRSPPIGPQGQGPFTNPPSGGAPTTPASPVSGSTLPATTVAQGQTPYQGTPATVPPATFPVYGAASVVLPAPPPGTIAVQLFERPAGDLQATYILYLKVERAP